KYRCPRESRGAKFHRDARQNRVEGISGKKEARSSARRFAARNLSAALHHGHVYAHPLFRRGKTRPAAESNCLRRAGGSFAANRLRRDKAYFSLREFSQPMHSSWMLSVGRFLLLFTV